MRNQRLSICRIDRKCISSDGEWDRTWDDSYEYFIYDEEGFEVIRIGWIPYQRGGKRGWREETQRIGGKKMKVKMKFNIGEEVSVMYRGELCKTIINGIDMSLARKGGEVRYILRIPNRGYTIVVESEIL